MRTIETNNFREATRCRRAQYAGRAVALSLNGLRFFGMVRSVQEDLSCHNDGLSQSYQWWRSSLSLVGGIVRAPRLVVREERVGG